MANIKDLGQKISSLRNMQKVMRAMNMIASIKLRKLISLQDSLKVFEASLRSIQTVLAGLPGDVFPPPGRRAPAKRIQVIIFTADKGLCGSHNSSVLKALDGFIAQQGQEGYDIDITAIGNKGANYCRRRDYALRHQYQSHEKVCTPKTIAGIVDDCMKRYESGEVAEIFVIYNRFLSTIQHETEIRQLLPLDVGTDEGKQAARAGGSGEVEPKDEKFMSTAERLLVTYHLDAALRHSYLSEHSSRMTAMENATDNSQDLIDKYITLQNRARQASITNELIEIISGKEAL